MARGKTGKRAQKRAPRRQRRGGLRTKGKGNHVNDVAAVSETFSFNPGGMDTIYWDYTCALAQHARASAVAQGYQEFRIKLIEYKFKPASDTYQAGGTQTVPYLYYLIDKLGANSSIYGVDGFRAAGAKPIRFDDKTVNIKYKPAVLTDTFDQASPSGVPRQYRISPWLSTTDKNVNLGVFVPSSVDHLGLRWVIDGTSADYAYGIERTVHIEFRKPMWNQLPGEALVGKSVEDLIPAKPEPVASS